MNQSANMRRKVSFTPIMLTSKSIRPVNRSEYELTRNEKKILQLRQHRDDLTNTLFDKAFRANQYPLDQLQNQIHLDDCLNEDEQQQNFRKLIKKMATPTVVKVQFQNELIHSRRQGDSKIKQNRQSYTNQQVRNQMNKALYFTNAKTFDEFMKMNKIKSSKKAKQLEEESTEEKWEKYLDKFYLSIKKVKPLLKKEDGIKLLSPQKISQISELQLRVQQQNKEAKEMLKMIPFRSHSRRETRHTRPRNGCTSVCEQSKSPQQIMPIETFKRIEQDITNHKMQTRKDYFVFGLSETTGKFTETQQIKAKLDNYWDFLFKVNFTNGLYVCSRDQSEKPLKFYVGFGNNSALVKGIMHRRYWWQLVDKNTEDINFFWTQLKISDVFKNQQKCQSKPKISKLKNVELLLPQSKDENDVHKNIMSSDDLKKWEKYYRNNQKYEEKGFQSALGKRATALLKKKKISLIECSNKLKTHNHLQCNYFLGNKKALFYSMRKYYQLKGIDPFTKIPLTFHITQGIQDPQFDQFLAVFSENNEKRKVDKQFKNIWIVKPGELTNRGRGITVCSTLDEIKIRLKTKEKNSNGTARTFIVQKYIERPLLYQKRKFDLRHYMAISCINGRIKGYWYADGYVRTTSSEYNIKNTKDLYTHLTNDAVQKNGQDYGKFQKGNKVSYADFRKYIMNTMGSDIDFYSQILPKMKEIATDTIRATYNLLDPERKQHNFQLFGLDFMLDEQLNVYLIEVNTNPCLQTSCPLLTKILTPLIQNLFKLFLDPLYPPPPEWSAQRKYNLGDNALQENKFTIVFDECQEGHQLRELYKNQAKIDDRMGDIFEEQEEYNDEEKQWNEDQQTCKK